MALFNEDEKVEEILNINVEVKTNKGNIRTICFKDFKKSIDNEIKEKKYDRSSRSKNKKTTEAICRFSN